jgi:hypothetical protein
MITSTAATSSALKGIDERLNIIGG